MTTPFIALAGGNEFRRDCDEMDRALLALLPPHAKVLIVPTAATNENPYVAGEHGIRHFRRLGAAPDKALILETADANHTQHAKALGHAQLLYFTGGDPVHLADTLRDSLAWHVIQTEHQKQLSLAGSSAGAMVLGGYFWRFDGWAPGLGLLPHLAVLPHHATLARRWDVGHMVTTLPAGVLLAGIDEATALLIPSGQVVGQGSVTLYTADGPQEYVAGESIPAGKLLAGPRPD